MSAYVLTHLAKADIFDIWSHIAEHNEIAADRVEQAVYDACAFLAEEALSGHTRPDLTEHPTHSPAAAMTARDIRKLTISFEET